MKFLTILFLILQTNVYAKTVCTMTFNSSNEKKVFQSNLSPLGYEQIELVPESKDPTWFKKACSNIKSCDILLISGHFGGIFFGDKAATLSLNELVNAREKSLCPAILDKPKAVYLMGCNTLSSKSPDHRSVNDYLRVLVTDGFPLNLAEDVTASRYLDFGQSMSAFMNSIFNKAQMIVGFESTGPLGAQAAPRLEKAFRASSNLDKNTTGLSKAALISAFKDTNLKVIRPEEIIADQLKIDVLEGSDQEVIAAWKTILNSKNISKNYDFIIKYQTNSILSILISNNSDIAQTVKVKMLEILKQANGLSEIQVRVLSFLNYHKLINHYDFEDSLIQINENILSRPLDYVSADQLCTLYSQFKDIDLINNLNPQLKSKLIKSSYGEYLYKCSGIQRTHNKTSKASLCLINHTTFDWGCLTENPKDLDVAACSLAKSRNSDPENADDMMWFCYSKMLENNYLTRASCLELTHNFSIFGNQLKMNWNCMNKATGI